MSRIFASERIRLTPITNADIPQFAEWLSDFGLQRLVNPGLSFPTSAADLLDPAGWFQADLKSEKSRMFAARTTDAAVFVGICALVNVNMFAHFAEIGINLANPDFRGRGYGREIMLLMLRYGFEQLNLNRINLRVMGFNTRAIRLYERLGFQHEVREREALFHDGQYFDQLRMGILRSEWQALHG
ncbi:MAG: GNAT family N-acetyltransferase [Anaerolineae bacterium]|nr:GNAT family N-acetyltransferase [Anaerolineae bacterium]